MQLNQYHLTKLQIDWRLPTVSQVEVCETRCRFDYVIGKHKTKENEFRMVLSVSAEEIAKEQPNIGYLISAELAGIFSFPEPPGKILPAVAVRVGGLNLLYGALRGVVAGITGSFPGGVFLFPTVNPQKIVMEIEKDKAARAKASKELSDVTPDKIDANTLLEDR